MNPNKEKFNNQLFYDNFLPLAQDFTNALYLELQENEQDRFEDLMWLHEQCYHQNKCKRKQKCGESNYSAILANILDAEVAKKSAQLVCENNELGALFWDAYCQNPNIKQYLASNNVFKFAQQFEEKLHYIVDNLFNGDENFEEAISLALNYAQFSCIYGIDRELTKEKQKEKRFTEFEKQIVTNTLNHAIQSMNVMLELGQSGFIALFGGRSVCTGQAVMTASLLDLAFEKLGIMARANLQVGDNHAFVVVVKDKEKFVIDPTQYFGTFKQIKKCDKENARQVKGAKILKHKKLDNNAHFKVINYFLNELNMHEKLDFVNYDDLVPVKLAKILGHMEKRISKMSSLIYPKGIYCDKREISAEFYFELCLNQVGVNYVTGCGTEDFVIKGVGQDYHIDISKAFDPKNKLRPFNKFIDILPHDKCDEK